MKELVYSLDTDWKVALYLNIESGALCWNADSRRFCVETFCAFRPGLSFISLNAIDKKRTRMCNNRTTSPCFALWENPLVASPPAQGVQRSGSAAVHHCSP